MDRMHIVEDSIISGGGIKTPNANVTPLGLPTDESLDNQSLAMQYMITSPPRYQVKQRGRTQQSGRHPNKGSNKHNPNVQVLSSDQRPGTKGQNVPRQQYHWVNLQDPDVQSTGQPSTVNGASSDQQNNNFFSVNVNMNINLNVHAGDNQAKDQPGST